MVLASTSPAVTAVVVAEPAIETIVETNMPQEEAPVALVEDLEVKYSFDEPKEKSEEA